MDNITISVENVNLVNSLLWQATQREECLRKSLGLYIDRQTELLQEIHAGKERERKLQQKCTSIEATAEQWERMFNEALTNYHLAEAQITTMEKESAEAKQALDAEVKSLRHHLAAKYSEGEELPFSPKDLEIQFLKSELSNMESNQVKWGVELDDEVKCILQDVTKSVLALVVDVEESQPGHMFGCPTTSIHKTKRQDVPEHLRSSPLESNKFECFENIRCAQAALADAAKNWKKAQDGAAAMLSVMRKEIMDKIVGRNDSRLECQP